MLSIWINYLRMKHLAKTKLRQFLREDHWKSPLWYFRMQATLHKTEQARHYGTEHLQQRNHPMNRRQDTKRHNNRAYGKNSKGDFRDKSNEIKPIQQGAWSLRTLF